MVRTRAPMFSLFSMSSVCMTSLPRKCHTGLLSRWNCRYWWSQKPRVNISSGWPRFSHIAGLNCSNLPWQQPINPTKLLISVSAAQQSISQGTQRWAPPFLITSMLTEPRCLRGPHQPRLLPLHWVYPWQCMAASEVLDLEGFIRWKDQRKRQLFDTIKIK